MHFFGKLASYMKFWIRLKLLAEGKRNAKSGDFLLGCTKPVQGQREATFRRIDALILMQGGTSSAHSGVGTNAWLRKIRRLVPTP